MTTFLWWKENEAKLQIREKKVEAGEEEEEEEGGVTGTRDERRKHIYFRF